MDSIVKKLKVSEGAKIKLKQYDPGYSSNYKKEDAEAVLNKLKVEMGELQEQFYSFGSHSMLLIFQAMDAAGKDSVIKHVMSGLNPQSCAVTSFKQPSAEELSHDFLWRHVKALPEKGKIGIHNRSHYENVLVCRVHPELVGEGNDTGKFWNQRYESIRNFEKHLEKNGTLILKFFLNVSKDEQKERFLERLSDPSKNWKFAAGDLEERKLWDKYMEAYETAFTETSTDGAPWFIIPADKKWFTRIAVAEIVLAALKDLKMKTDDFARFTTKEIEDFREKLSAE